MGTGLRFRLPPTAAAASCIFRIRQPGVAAVSIISARSEPSEPALACANGAARTYFSCHLNNAVPGKSPSRRDIVPRVLLLVEEPDGRNGAIRSIGDVQPNSRIAFCMEKL